MQDSKIAWTNHTFNIAWGCTKISPGCKNCYADTLSSRYGHDVSRSGLYGAVQIIHSKILLRRKQDHPASLPAHIITHFWKK